MAPSTWYEDINISPAGLGVGLVLICTLFSSIIHTAQSNARGHFGRTVHQAHSYPNFTSGPITFLVNRHNRWFISIARNALLFPNKSRSSANSIFESSPPFLKTDVDSLFDLSALYLLMKYVCMHTGEERQGPRVSVLLLLRECKVSKRDRNVAPVDFQESLRTSQPWQWTLATFHSQDVFQVVLMFWRSFSLCRYRLHVDRSAGHTKVPVDKLRNYYPGWLKLHIDLPHTRIDELFGIFKLNDCFLFPSKLTLLRCP